VTLRLETKEDKMGIKMTGKNREKSWCGWFRHKRDPVKLHDRICKERSGSNFATNWILTVFKYGVSEDMLNHILKPQEIAAMDFKGGFKPQQVYDGFITKVGEIYECELCKEDKKMYWKAKKNAPCHLHKFHFQLADVCDIWYAKSHHIFIELHP
jgi:hypothetical protein